MRARAVLAAVGVVLVAPPARSDDLAIRRPHDHPPYVMEIEPHGLIAVGKDVEGVGAGARATIILVDPGFVRRINDTVGLGAGLDIVTSKGQSRFLLPVVMQWNFFLSRRFSVFGEPGGVIAFGGSKGAESKLSPVLSGGGRVHFGDTVALTVRVGYPALSVGVSFLF